MEKGQNNAPNILVNSPGFLIIPKNATLQIE
jgi:hypothetical protein